MDTNTESNKMKSRQALVFWLAAVLLVGFSWGRWSAPLAAWIGPALFIRFYRDLKTGRGYLLILAGCILSAIIGWWNVFPLAFNIIIYIFYGLLTTLPYLADRLLVPRIGGFAATLVYPLAAVSLEFVNRLTNPLGDWGAVGYTQFGNLALMQLVSVTGMLGITFLIGWSGSIANWVWEALRQARPREINPGAAVYGAIMAAVFAFGSLRLALAPYPAVTVRVAGITPQSARAKLLPWRTNLPGAAEASAEVALMRDAYFDSTVREAQAGAQIVVWPEISGGGFAADEAGLIARGKQVARQQGIYLTIPLYTIYPGESRPAENKLLLIDPAGEVVLEHIKYGGNIMEGTLRGEQRVDIADTPLGVLAGVLCWDMDFPRVIRQASHAKAGLLLVPSSDWAEITPIHSQMATFRAVENGLSVVRQADNGLSITADPYGRILAQVDYFASSDRTMVAQVPINHIPTIYSRIGDALGWVSLAGFVGMLVWGTRIKRQH